MERAQRCHLGALWYGGERSEESLSRNQPVVGGESTLRVVGRRAGVEELEPVVNSLVEAAQNT
jgi:hypothetical protein